MQRKIWLISLATFLLSSCGSAPKVTVCISDPKAGGFDCYNEDAGTSFFLGYGQSDKYVAFNPTDAQTLLDFCSQGAK